MVSIMNEALELEVGHKVLEIGSGCGWHASTVAEIIASSDAPEERWGHVFTVEIVPQLAEFARKNIQRLGYDSRVTVVCGDGSEGYAEEAPFDRILVTAAAPYVPPPLKEQLKTGGVMVIPVGAVGFYQTLMRLRKVNSQVLEEDLGGVAFVPLVGKHGHKSLWR
jgi:protein-L-isoaspartate(D-aspartate) O-methyltransferase